MESFWLCKLGESGTVFFCCYLVCSYILLTPIENVYLQEETVEDFVVSGVDPLTVSLYQMDLDRTQFLLRSYLRIRLQKVVIIFCVFVRMFYLLCGNQECIFQLHIQKLEKCQMKAFWILRKVL